MNYLYHDAIVLIHLLTAILALITGTAVLAMKKGTRRHKKLGYVYAASMLGLNLTALMIYRLFGGFGIFHIAALVSLFTLAGGMVPAIRRKPAKWIEYHYAFMYWSVMGLYAAFVSEIATRVPQSPFFEMVGIATGIVMFFGGGYFYLGKHRWEKFSAGN